MRTSLSTNLMLPENYQGPTKERCHLLNLPISLNSCPLHNSRHLLITSRASMPMASIHLYCNLVFHQEKIIGVKKFKFSGSFNFGMRRKLYPERRKKGLNCLFRGSSPSARKLKTLESIRPHPLSIFRSGPLLFQSSRDSLPIFRPLPPSLGSFAVLLPMSSGMLFPSKLLGPLFNLGLRPLPTSKAKIGNAFLAKRDVPPVFCCLRDSQISVRHGGIV